MSALDRINIGVVGVCGGYGRGGIMVPVLNAVAPFRVQALCDLDRAGLERANAAFGVEELYFDYDEMLATSNLDAVFVATPMHLHVPQAIAALERDIHVLCEVTAATSIEQCRALVAACARSEAVYMLAENVNYMREVAAVRGMVEQGVFGTPYYAEGGYVADAKALGELTPWRREWQLGVNGITYITHNLGPMLQWLPGERIVAVCCAGSGHHYRDPRGEPYGLEDNCTMLGRTSGGGQVVIRSDFLSNRPDTGVYNALQGTAGSYASPRRAGEPHLIWLESKSASATREWSVLHELDEPYLPEGWRNALATGSGWDCDHFMVQDFVNAIRGQSPTPLGIHEAMDLTLPGLVSQRSIAAGGAWMEIPDSRTWQ
jgi:predicted dehydrogenase